MTTNVLQPGSSNEDVKRTKDAEAEAQAIRAAKAFRQMIPTLQAFVRVLTGRNDVRVVCDGRPPMTDGKTLYVRPPFALGLTMRHNKVDCDKRDPDTLSQLCPACKAHESVMAALYHEISHIVFDSFMATSDQDKTKAIERIINKFKGKMRERVRERMNTAPPSDLNNYASLARLINPYLPMLINAIEDARVNRRMSEARPGVRNMTRASNIDVMVRGIEQPDGTIDQWSDAPLGAQLATALYFEMSGTDGMLDFFDDEVKNVFEHKDIKQLVIEGQHTDTVADSFEVANRTLETCQKYGFYQDPEDQEEDEDGEGDDGEGAGGEDGEQSEPPSTGGDGSDGDSQDQEQSDPADGSDSGDGDGDGDDDGDSESSSSGGSGEGDVDSEADSEAGEGSGEVPPGQSGSGGAPSDGGSGRGDAQDDAPDEAGDDSSEGRPEEADDADQGDGDGDGEDSDDAPTETPEGEEVDEGAPGSGEDHQGEGEGESERGEESGADDEGEASPLDQRSDSSDGVPQPSPGLPEPERGQGEGVPERAMDEDGGDPSEPIDTGADEGKGGVKSNQRIGSAEDNLKIIEQILGHAHSEPHDGDPSDEGDGDADPWGMADEEDVRDPSTAELDELMERAVIKGTYFETPPQNVDGFRLHTRRNHHLNEAGVDISYGFSHGHFRKYGLDRWSAGIDADLEISESILGPALMQMRRTFEDNKRASMLRNQKSGRIRSASLGKRGFTDDERLFQKKRIPSKKDYAVLIGIDISGSTVGVNIKLAKRAAKAQAELLHRAGVKFAIYAHSARGTDEDIYSYNHLTLDIYEVKGWDDAWDTETKNLLQELGPDHENLDGHTMEYYRKVLDQRTEQEKILLYYTDGKMPAANAQEELEVLKREIQEFKRRRYTLLGVGIRTDSPTRHGLETVQVNTDEDLVNVIKQLGTKLTAD